MKEIQSGKINSNIQKTPEGAQDVKTLAQNS